jgi:hypothetical protein
MRVQRKCRLPIVVGTHTFKHQGLRTVIGGKISSQIPSDSRRRLDCDNPAIRVERVVDQSSESVVGAHVEKKRRLEPVHDFLFQRGRQFGPVRAIPIHDATGVVRVDCKPETTEVRNAGL